MILKNTIVVFIEGKAEKIELVDFLMVYVGWNLNVISTSPWIEKASNFIFNQVSFGLKVPTEEQNQADSWFCW